MTCGTLLAMPMRLDHALRPQPMPDHRVPRHRRPDQRWWSTPEWRKLRRQVVIEEPVCRICGVAPTTTADHIVPVDAGGAVLDRSNLQGACGPCNSGKGAMA